MKNSSVNSHELHKFHEFVFIREIRGVIFIHLLVRRRRMLSPLKIIQRRDAEAQRSREKQRRKGVFIRLLVRHRCMVSPQRIYSI